MNGGIFIGDRYEVLSKVGAGGMADVYKGKDHKLNRFVAIKILKKEYREDDMFVRKFQSEAQAAAGLMHPNIVNVYDVGEESGLYFMVMELVEGITLKEYINKKGVLSAKEGISIAIQIANGIEAAHMHNIVHRDIKPQNIIISKEGKVKVTDFGIAKATSSNTISTNALGSVHYTSPEQARGGFSDFKSDIYSLGITMYEMVTGHVPFDGDTAVSIAIKHLQEEITPPSEYVEDIPYSLEQIILKCTQKSADRRYPDIHALKEDLKRSLVDPDGDFVVIGSAKGMGETVMFTPEDMGRIQREAKRGIRKEDYDKEDDDDFEDDYDDDDYEDEDYQRNSRKKGGDVNPNMAKILKILTIVAVVIIAFVIIVIAGKATGLLKFGPSAPIEEEQEKDKTVKLPYLLGKTEEEASAILGDEKYDIGVSIESWEESTEYEKGQIIRQTPEAGSEVKKNTTVKVVISSGKVGEKKPVPSVSGMSEDRAEQELNDNGFINVRREYESSSEYASGEAIRTNPESGEEVSVDTEIIMYVSKGEEKPVVPGLKGKSESDAIAALEASRLNVGTVDREYDDNVESGKVISQTVAAGKRVPIGTSVGITVSKGKKPEEKTEVPGNIIGMGEYNAKNAIQNAGLIWAKGTPQYSDKYAAGEVMDCSPTPGSSVSPNTTVTVIISLGKEPTPNEPAGEDGETGAVQ